MGEPEGGHTSEPHASGGEHGGGEHGGGEHGGGEHHHSLAERIIHAAHPVVSTLGNIHLGIHAGLPATAEHAAAHHLAHQRATWVAEQTQMSRDLGPVRPAAPLRPQTPQTLRTDWDDPSLSSPAPATPRTRVSTPAAEPLTPPNLEPVPVPVPNASVPPMRTPASGDMASYVDSLHANGAIAEPVSLVPPPALPAARPPAAQTPLTLRTDWDNSLLRPPQPSPLPTPQGPAMAEYVDNLRAHGAIPSPTSGPPPTPPADPDVLQLRPPEPTTLPTPRGPAMAEYVDNLRAHGAIPSPTSAPAVTAPMTAPNLEPVPTGVSLAPATPDVPASLTELARDVHPETGATRLLNRVEQGLHVAGPVLSTAELVLGADQMSNGVDRANGSDVAQGALGVASGGAGLLSTVGLATEAAPVLGAATTGYGVMRQVNDASGEAFEYFGAMTTRQRRGVSADPDHRDPGRERVGDNRSLSDRFTDAHYDPRRNHTATRNALAMAPHLPRYLGGDLPGLTGHDDAIADAFSRVGMGAGPGESGPGATITALPSQRQTQANAATMRALGVDPGQHPATPASPLVTALRQAQANHQTEPAVTVLPSPASADSNAATMRALGLAPNGQPLPAVPAADTHTHTTADGAPYSL